MLWSWTLRTIRARYQQSVLGWLWAVAQPAAQVAIFTLVFTQFVRVDTGGIPYILFAYVALTPWAFLSTSLTDMCGAIVDNLRLVTKIYFPREVLPIAAMLARVMDLGVASLLIVTLVVYYQVPVRLEQLALLPVVLTVQFMLVLGIGFGFAAANTFVRDMRPLLVLILQLWFYLSPIIYPVAAVPENLRSLYVLNPMVGIIEAHRAIWLNQPFPGSWLASAALVSLACLTAGYWFFKKSEAAFADIG
jgi:lipopolysaccharide transport system permease protein